MNHLQQLINSLKKQQQQLIVLKSNASSDQMISNQFQCIIKAYRNMIQKVETRKRRQILIAKQSQNGISFRFSKNEMQQMPIISDIFMMQSVALLVTFMQSKIYFSEKMNIEIQEIDRESAKQFLIIDQNQMLQIPTQNISNNLIQAIKTYQSKVKSKDNLHFFYNWFQKELKNIEHQKQIKLTSQQLRNKFIISQYSLVATQAEIQLIDKIIYKILLFNIIRKSAKKAQKNIQQRKKRIQQIVQGEKKYTQKLNKYIDLIKRPIQSLNILNQSQQKRLFSNIQAIRGFHIQLYQQLNDKYQSYQKREKFAPIFKKNIPFFKLYLEYIFEMNDGAQNLLIKKSQQRPQINKICQKFYIETGFKASDVMMEPVFKIAKYQLFFKDIIKHTNRAHPDKLEMQQVLQRFSSILSSVNNNISKIMGQNRIYQLDRQFGTQQNPIVTENRFFIDQFCTQTFIDKTKSQTRVIVFNDIALIVNQNAKQVIYKIQYDDRFHIEVPQKNQVVIIEQPKIIRTFCTSQRQAVHLYEIFKQIQNKNVKNYLYYRFKRQNKMFKKYRQQVLREIGHQNFPISDFLKVLQKFETSLQRRRKLKWQYFSDIFYFYSVDMLVSLIKMTAYVQQQLKSNNESFKKIYSIESIKNLWQDNAQQIKNEEDILMVPIKFVKIKIQNILQNFVIKVKTVSKIQDEQMKSISNFIKWYRQTCDNIAQNQQKLAKLKDSENKNSLIKTQYKSFSQKINLKMVKKLILFGKIRAKARKSQQRLNKKKLTLLQLVEGQQKYIQKLIDYINLVKNPIQNISEIKQQTCRKLFSTVVQIKDFHSQFFRQIEKKYYEFQKYQCYGQTFKTYLPFFKLYSQYIYNANHQKSQEILKQLQYINPKVKRICKDFLNAKKITAVDALLQPTNRVAKYSFIFQNLIKYTNPDHPDFLALKQTLKLFQQISAANNRHVNKIVNMNKLIQLDMKYSTKQNSIISKKRELIQEYNVFMVKDSKGIKVILYVLNDMLLLVDSTSKNLILKIVVDYRFFVRKQQDNRINKNLIKIHSENFVHISPGNQERFQSKRQQIFKLLQSISQQGQNVQSLVQVSILGTQSVASTSIAKHTKYIIQFKYKGFKRRTYLRFSDMQKILCEVYDHYQGIFQILEQTNLQKSFLNNYKEETIQKRKNNIEQILQKLINDEKVRKNPDFFLKLVGLNQNFFENAERSYKKSMQLLTADKAANARLAHAERKDALTILCATQIKLGKNIFFDIQQNKGIGKILEQNNNLKIKIRIFNKAQNVTVLINEETKVEQVLDKVSKLIGLRNNKDFRIFHEIGKKESRVLDPQQQIFQLFKNKLTQSNNESSKPGFISSTLKRIFNQQQNQTYLSLKKHFFLPEQIEQKQFSNDLVRLKLLVYQAFSEINDIKYHLSFDQYMLFLAMFIFIEFSGEQVQKKVMEVDPYIVHKVIPQQIFKTKNYTEKQLLQKTLNYLAELNLSIDKIIRKNTVSVHQSSIKIQNNSKRLLFFNKQFICCRIFLTKISKNPTYGASLFYVQLQKQTCQIVEQKAEKTFYNVWLSLKLNQVALLTPTTKQKILELNYSNIQKIVVYSEAIIIKMDELRSEHREYKMNTFQSYIISEFFKHNKALDYVLNELQDDSELIYKTKLYKSQLLECQN